MWKLNNNMKKINKIKKGFTLIEMIVSVFIFSIIITATVVVFSGYIKTHKYSRIVQKNLEGVQFAFNYMAKTLRVSDVIDEGSVHPDRIFTYSDANQACTTFYFYDKAIWYKTLKLSDIPASVPLGDKVGDRCGNPHSYNLVSGSKLTIGEIDHSRFEYSYTSRGNKDTNTPPTVGLVTISAAIKDKTTDKGLVWAQTSVSLLNYSGEITF